MSRVLITDFAPTLGNASSTYIADPVNANLTLATALSARNIVFIREGTYNFTNTYAIASGKTIIGQPGVGSRPVLKMASGINKTVITNANASTGGITTGVTMKNLIIDQQGTLQTAGGGLVVTGIQGWTLDEIRFKKSYRFNFLCLHQSVGISNNTGTVTLTKDSTTMVGSGTLFMTQLSVGSIVKSVGNQFARIQSIASDTSLTLTRPWGYVTEAGVTYKTIQPNSGSNFSRIVYEGTVDNADASGYGFFDNATIRDSEAFGADGGGCGFVPDHARSVQLINLVAHGNNNSGISLETSEDCIITNPVTHSNVGGNGIQFISGTSRCEVDDGISFNQPFNGYAVSYNTTNDCVPTGNIFRRCKGYSNGGYAFRNDGGDATEYDTVKGYNNDTGGLIINTATHVSDAVHVHHSEFYDDRGGAKSQDRGIYIVAGTNTTVNDNIALDSLHVVAGIVNNGTNTTLSNNTT